MRQPGGHNLRRWLTPGIGVKRWLLVLFAGLLMLALGVAHLIRQASRDLRPDGFAQVVIDAVTLQFLPYQLRGLTFGAVGLLLVAIGAYRAARALTDPFRSAEGGAARRAHLPEAVPRPRAADRGDRRWHRPLDAAARPEGAHEQPDGGRGGRRRRRLVRRAPRGARDPARRRHPALHRRPGRCRAAHERAPPVPISRPRLGSGSRGRRFARRSRGRQPADRGDDRGRGR